MYDDTGGKRVIKEGLNLDQAEIYLKYDPESNSEIARRIEYDVWSLAGLDSCFR